MPVDAIQEIYTTNIHGTHGMGCQTHLVDVLEALHESRCCLLLGSLEEVDEHLGRDVSEVAQSVEVPVFFSFFGSD